MAVPSIKSLYECFVKMHKADRVKMGQKAREWMIEEYDTKKVFNEKWKPLLTKLEEETYGKQVPLAKEKEKGL